MRELIEDEGGVGVIELALIVPLLILLTAGVLDVARAMNAAVVLESMSGRFASHVIVANDGIRNAV